MAPLGNVHNGVMGLAGWVLDALSARKSRAGERWHGHDLVALGEVVAVEEAPGVASTTMVAGCRVDPSAAA